MTIPQVHIYQPPTGQDDQQNDISHSRTPSLQTTSEPDNDAHAELLGKDEHKIKHTRNFSTASTTSSTHEDEQDRALLSHDALTKSRTQDQTQQKTSTRSKTKTKSQTTPLPAPIKPTRPRSDSRRYYSQTFTEPISWSKDETEAYLAFEKQIEREAQHDTDLESGSMKGYNTGLWLLGSWRNTRKEWRHGSRARVLKHYLGASLLVVLVLAVIAIVGVIVAWSVQWR